MTDPTRLIDRYLDGTLTQEELAQLEQDLATNVNYADAFAHVMMIDWLLADRIERDAITSTMQLGDGQFLGEQDLKHLQEDYDQAEAALVRLDEPDHAAIHIKTNDDLNRVPWSEVASALSYGVRLMIRSKPVPIVGTLVAAVLLLALWLINPFAGTEQPSAPGPDVAQSTSPEDYFAPVAIKPTVATITAAYNAKWASNPAGGALALPVALTPGSKLHPNQRLTLTAGFAEITTARGAIAILQAPATIELLDNENALRLHAGKLVGICETESSKGFLVHTPHMDITDIGTRFGVNASRSGSTDVHVLEGQVQVAQSNITVGAAIDQRLSEGDAIRAGLGVRGFGTIELDSNSFAAMNDFALASEAGIASMSGDVKWVDASPYLGVDFDQWPARNLAVLIEETRSHTLKTDFGINVEAAEPHRITGYVEAGTTINSYILILHADGSNNRYEGEITFDGEILGIITGMEWPQAVTQLKAGGVPALVDSSVLNRVDIEATSDSVEILPDRRTLRFSMVDIRGSDAVRVIVRKPSGDQP